MTPLDFTLMVSTRVSIHGEDQVGFENFIVKNISALNLPFVSHCTDGDTF